MLAQYKATSSTYGIAPKANPATVLGSYARPATSTVQRATPMAGGSASGGGGSAGAGVSRPTYGRPATPAPAPVPAAAPKTPYVNPFAAKPEDADRQRQIQMDQDARGKAQYEAAMQQQAMMDARRAPPQDDGGGYQGFQPTPIPIAEGPTPLAEPQAQPSAPMVMGQAEARPDVGGGWGDFAARPSGPQGLGLSKATTPMQALRATRANGGLY